jgi:hypothetical protein
MQSACRCRPLPIVPAMLLVVLPKCPLCLGAWFGFFGAVGVGSWVAGVWGVPLGAALLAITVSVLAVRAFRTHDLRPVPFGLVGAAALLAGEHFSNVLLLCAGGCFLLLAVTLKPPFGKKPSCRKLSGQRI